MTRVQAPMRYTNEEKVARCLDVLLAEVRTANGFLTPAVYVERLHGENSAVLANGQLRAAARGKAGTKVLIRDGSLERDPTCSQRGRKRWNKVIELHCLHTLQVDERAAGLLIDDVMQRLRDDVTWLLDLDEDLRWAWSKVLATTPAMAGETKPSCGVLKVAGADRISPLETDGYQILYVENTYDTFAPTGLDLPPV